MNRGERILSIMTPGIPLWAVYCWTKEEEKPQVSDIDFIPIVALALTKSDDGTCIQYVEHSGEGFILDFEVGASAKERLGYAIRCEVADWIDTAIARMKKPA